MNVFRALGLVEVLGSADAIQAVDVMLKTSEVEFQTWHTKCGGHTTVFGGGDGGCGAGENRSSLRDHQDGCDLQSFRGGGASGAGKPGEQQICESGV